MPRQGNLTPRIQSRPSHARAVVALLVTAVALMGWGGLVPPTAWAATTGVSTTVDFGDVSYQGTPVLEEGQSASLTLQYHNTVTPGSTVEVKLPANVTVGQLPATNTAITKLTKAEDGTVSITFADPFPGDVHQGVLKLDFTLTSVERSEKTLFEWTVNGEVSSVPVVELDEGDTTQQVTTAQSKQVAGDLNRYVSVAQGTVVVSEQIIGAPLTYTLSADNSQAHAGYRITDQLPVPLSYVTDSFSAQWTTWDADGLNRTVGQPQPFTPTVTGTSVTGERFVTSFDVPAGSEVDVTYRATVADEAARQLLQTMLQDRWNAAAGNENGGSWQVALTNRATIGGVVRSATTTLGGRIPGPSRPNLTYLLSKSVDEPVKNIERAEDGVTLAPEAPTVWSFAVDLTPFNGTTSDWYRLRDNVVVSDTLERQARWLTEDPDFITSTKVPLTRATACSSVADFSADEFVNTWCVNGQTLMINLGKDNTLKETLRARSAVTTVAGLSGGTTSVQGGQAWTMRNRAYFHYRSAASNQPQEGYSTRWVTLVDRGKDEGNGYNDPAAFAKTAPGELTVKPGHATPIPYTFTVAGGKGRDVRTLTVVDKADPDVFDLSDLDAVANTLHGTYQGIALRAEHFTLTRDDEGDLRIRLSEAGRALVTAPDQKWVVNLTLTTKPVIGKQTVAVENLALLEGTTEETRYWSEADSSVTSYGDEAEVAKSVWDAENAAWTNNLRAPLDARGHLPRDTFVYRVQFLPHGGYDKVHILTVRDVLPQGTEFVGFVDADNVDSQASPSTATRDIGGNVEATWDAARRTVRLQQKDGTLLDSRGPITAYFVVRLTDPTRGEPVVNRIGQVSAAITPTNDYPVAVTKRDDTDLSVVITDRRARFQLTDSEDSNGTVLVDGIAVVDGDLRVLGTDGTPVAVTVPRPGTYWLHEVTAPAGYQRSEAPLQIVVDDDGSHQETFFNTPLPDHPETDPSEDPSGEPSQEPSQEPTPAPDPSADPTASTPAPTGGVLGEATQAPGADSSEPEVAGHHSASRGPSQDRPHAGESAVLPGTGAPFGWVTGLAALVALAAGVALVFAARRRPPRRH